MTPTVSNAQFNSNVWSSDGASSKGALPVGNSDSGAAATFERTAVKTKKPLTRLQQYKRDRMIKHIAQKYNISEEIALRLLKSMQLPEVLAVFNTNDENRFCRVRIKIENSIDNAISKSGVKSISEDNIEMIADNAARYTIGALQNKTADEVDELRSQHKSASSLLEEYIPEDLKGKTLSEMSDEEVKSVVKQYFEKINLKEDLERIKNATGREQKELIEALKTKQLNAFYQLAIVANDEDIKILASTIDCVINEAMPDMIDIVKAIFQRPEQRTRFANRLSTGFSMRHTDVTGRMMSCDVAEKTTAFITQNVDEEHAQAYSEQLNEDMQYANTVEDKVLEIAGKEKLSDLTPEDIETLMKNPNITDEEKSFLVEVMLSGTMTGFEAGSMAGFADNHVISTDLQQKILEEITANASELTNYEEVLAAVKTYIEEHSLEFSSDVKTIEEVLNKATDGKYGEVAETVDLSSGKSESDKGSAQSDDGVGFKAPEEKPVVTVTNPIIIEEDSEPEFVVERTSMPEVKNESGNASLLSAAVSGGYSDIQACLRNGFTGTQLVGEILDNIQNATDACKNYVTSCLSNKGFAGAFSGKAMNNTLIARLFVKAGSEDTIDTEHSISYVRDMLEDRKEKPDMAV